MAHQGDTIVTENEFVEKKTCMQKFVKGLRDNLFTVFTLIGVAIGFGIGFGVAPLKPSPVAIDWIKILGTLYIRMLQLTILPIIAANIIIVMAGMDPKKNGSIGYTSIIFIVAADLLGGAIGVIVGAIMQPGISGGNVTVPAPDDSNEAAITTSDVFADLFYNIFPDNIVAIALYQTQTMRTYPNINDTTVTKRTVGRIFSTDMIGLIFVSIVFGIAARAAGENGKSFIEFFKSLCDVVLKIMIWFLQLTPVGVCFMVAGTVVGLDDVSGTFQRLGMFMAAVMVALAIHMLLQMTIYGVVAGRNPFRILVIGFPSFFIAFMTTSPMVAIPEYLEACDKFGIKKRVSRFVIPLSAALKGDGSGAFQAVACVYVAQTSGFPLNPGIYVIIALLTGIGVLAVPNIPSSSIVIVLTITKSLGIPSGPVSLLYAIDWLMDRCRSGNIGYGHLFCAAFTQAVAVGRRKEDPSNLEDDEDEESEGKSRKRQFNEDSNLELES